MSPPSYGGGTNEINRFQIVETLFPILRGDLTFHHFEGVAPVGHLDPPSYGGCSCWTSESPILRGLLLLIEHLHDSPILRGLPLLNICMIPPSCGGCSCQAARKESPILREQQRARDYAFLGNIPSLQEVDILPGRRGRWREAWPPATQRIHLMDQEPNLPTRLSLLRKSLLGIRPTTHVHGLHDQLPLHTDLDMLEDDTFENLLRLASSGRIGSALAAPYCCKHSRATLRPHGPAPVRTPEFLDGLPSNTIQQQLALQESSTIHDRSRSLLSAVDRHAGLVIMENPSTSMTWDDSLMYDWVHAIAPFAAQACACQFDKDWAKAWMFVANRPTISHLARSCPHPHGTHEQIVGVRLPDGTFKSRITAEYPPQLAQALAYNLHHTTISLHG